DETCIYGIAWNGVLPVGRVIYRTRDVAEAPGTLLELDGVTEPAAFLTAFLDAGGTTEVLVDRATLRPRTAYWITANPDDPVRRSAWFLQQEGRALTAKSSRDGVRTRIVEGDTLMDPLTAIYLARVVDFEASGGELRLKVLEGVDVHLMTLRPEGREPILQD